MYSVNFAREPHGVIVKSVGDKIIGSCRMNMDLIKRNSWKIAIIFLSVAMLSSCLTSSNGGGAFFPLAVGNRWRMVDYTRENGTLKISDTSEIHVSKSTTVLVAGEHLAAYKINWYYPLSVSISNPDSVFWIERMESDGLNLYGFSHGGVDTIFGKTMDIKHPALIGESWYRKVLNWTGLGWVANITEVEMAQTDTLISTPAGRFHCFAVRTSYTAGSFNFEYYSPGIGPVAYKTISNDTLTAKSLLLSYSLK